MKILSKKKYRELIDELKNTNKDLVKTLNQRNQLKSINDLLELRIQNIDQENIKLKLALDKAQESIKKMRAAKGGMTKVINKLKEEVDHQAQIINNFKEEHKRNFKKKTPQQYFERTKIVK